MKSPRADAPCGVTTKDLLRFAAGESRGAEKRQILEHLLGGCEPCREGLAELKQLRQEPALDEHPDGDAASVSRILASLGERAERIERERHASRNHLAAFLGHPLPRQWTLLRNSRRYDTWSFCSGLLETAFQAMYDDPRRSREQAEMALQIAERLPAEPYGARSVADLRARAWAHLGNARRALGDFPGALEALRLSRNLLQDGTGDPLEEAELLYYEASLLRGERRLEEATRKIRRSIRLYREVGDTHLEGRSILNQASIELVKGNAETARGLVLQAIEKIDGERDPRLALAARHNLVWETMEAGRLVEAIDLLHGYRSDFEQLGASSRLRFSWLEAKLLHRLERTEEARAAYQRCVQGFGEVELPYEVALVSLEWAVLELGAARLAEVRRLAGETLTLFRSIGVAREAIAAWMVLERAVEAQTVTAALLDRLTTYFQRSKLRPELQFEG
jgi:tetratricopeptide (TPR) repeat protein